MHEIAFSLLQRVIAASGEIKTNFEPHTRPAEDDEYRLLIFDGHESHITYEFIEYANVHRIICLCLPAHSAHLLQPLDVVIFGRYAAEYSKVLDNASRRGVTGINKELFMQLFQEAPREVFTNRLCRSAFRSTGIHPYNPDAVLKNIPELKTTENRIGTPPAPDGSTSMTPKRTTQELLPPLTPHNAIGVKEHAAVVLQEFDSLACQGSRT
jgi:hypothetical protein